MRVVKPKNIDIDKLKRDLINQKNELFNLYSRSHLSKLKNTSLIEYQWKKIIIVAGDPNSINSEIIYKSLKR